MIRMTPGRRRLLIGGGLLLVTAALYSPVRSFSFVDYDDPIYVTEEPHVRAGLTWAGVRWAFTSFHAFFWHPLTSLSLMLDAELWGPDGAGGFHLTNVGLHCGSTLLLFLLLEGLTGAAWRSAVVAGLFAWHPLHVESVAWVGERKDVLSALFWMLATAAYVAYVRRPTPRRYALLLAAFVLGLMAKPMLVTLPCVLLLLDVWPLRRFDVAGGWPAWRPRLLEKAPLFVFGVAAGVLKIIGHHNDTLVLYPLVQRTLNAPVHAVSYLGKMVWPHDLTFYAFDTEIDVVRAAGAALLLLGLTVAAVAQVGRRPYLAVGWLWYLATLAPVSGIVQVASHGMADRYTYIPLIGVFIALVWRVAEAVENRPSARGLVSVLAVVVLAACSFLTSRQLDHWRDPVALWTHAAAAAPDNATSLNNLAWIRAAHPDPHHRNGEEAVRLALRANALEPGIAAFVDTLAGALAEAGRFPEAVEVAEKARRMALAQGSSALAADVERRLAFYRRGLPVRE